VLFEIDVQNDLAYPVDGGRLSTAAQETLRQQAAVNGAALSIVVLPSVSS